MNSLKTLRGALVFYFMCSLTAMAPMNLSFFIFLIACIFTYFKANRRCVNFNETPEFKSYRFWAITLLITCWGSLILARIFPYAYAGHDPEVTFHGFLKIWYLLIPAILVYGFELGSECKSFSLATIIKPWWVVTIILMFISIIQFFTGWPHAQPIPTNPGYFHATLFLGHHLSTSSILIFPTFTALAVALGFYTRSSKTSIPPISPRLALLVGLSGTLILFLSYARTAWIALLIGAAFLAKKYLLPKLNRKQWIGSAIATVILLGLFSQTPLVKDRIIKTFGVSDRVELWKANIDFFTHRPFTGIGWLKTQEMSEFYFKVIDPEHYRRRFWGHAHSNFFEMLGGTGLFGLLAFFGWSIFTLRFSYQLSKRFEESSDYFHSDITRGIFIALILLHFNGLTNVTFWEGKVMHQQMLAVGMLLILSRTSKLNLLNNR